MAHHERGDIESFIRALPDPVGARTFLKRLESSGSISTNPHKLGPLVLSRLLTIAAYSPFLAETILRHPEHIAWLSRETEMGLDRGKTTEQLSEDLARFATRMIGEDQGSHLSQFKRRELLRIYLRDCLGVATLSEVTEELSNLADVILRSALSVAYQELVNRHGTPFTRDERGRMIQAEFAVVALGKLGCRELNYASDIDLLFLYLGEGQTAGSGRRRETGIDNKEFFTAVAHRIVELIGSKTGEGAVYRIDLRLRPYGRDGDMVWEVARAVNYYREKAQNWERQALIRARASAGSDTVVNRFLELVRDAVFRPEALPDSLADVRRAKEKIDLQQATRTGGYNVKLGRGGIREIEFIAQALQLAYGGREPWVRSAQTLIVLARLAEKGYLSESERTRLSTSYTFLRTVEHRLQMEHGVQTHSLPLAADRLEVLARRSGYATATDPVAAFNADLEANTSAVRAVYNRVFLEKRDDPKPPAASAERADERPVEPRHDDETDRLIQQAAAALERLLASRADSTGADSTRAAGARHLERVIGKALVNSINPLRSLREMIGWTGSLATYDQESARAIMRTLSGGGLPVFIERLSAVLSSQYLSNIIVSKPPLAGMLINPESTHTMSEFLQVMGDAVERAEGVAAKTDALRRTWYRLVLEIGYRDISVFSPRQADYDRALSENSLRLNNLEQTALAEASLHLALEITLASLGVRDVEPGRDRSCNLPFTVMGLGRLGHTGMDYGSDLDLLVVYDDRAAWPPPGLDQLAGYGTPQEFYAKLTSTLVRVLSSVTREGFLYRIDLRLRPDGQNGQLAQGMNSLIAYLLNRASAWEHSAYLKAREVAGDLPFGARVRDTICDAVFDAASGNPSLRGELARMRARLEREKAAGSRRNIKWGPGGMTDVYFITRYLQLRHRICYPTEKGTTRLIGHLGDEGWLGKRAAGALFEGYSFLRRLDHWMRLLLDRPGPVLPASHLALRDIALALGLGSIEEFEREYARHSESIRAVYDEVFFAPGS